VKIRELPKVIVGRTEQKGQCKWCKRPTHEYRVSGGRNLGRSCSDRCADAAQRWLPLPLEAA
jgi:hypothetical protein